VGGRSVARGEEGVEGMGGWYLWTMGVMIVRESVYFLDYRAEINDVHMVYGVWFMGISFIDLGVFGTLNAMLCTFHAVSKSNSYLNTNSTLATGLPLCPLQEKLPSMQPLPNAKENASHASTKHLTTDQK
jgi:hypothetical protein